MIESKVTVGAVLSILKAWEVAPAGVVLPALSLNSGLRTSTASPSPDEIADWVAVAGPDTASVAVKDAVTSVLYQPLAFGFVVAPALLTAGAVLSILKACEA